MKRILFPEVAILNLRWFLAVVAVILSSTIPGSPLADDTLCIDEDDFVSKSIIGVVPIVGAWIGVDLIFHVVFTVL